MKNYEQRYKEALERAKCMHEQGMMPERLEYVFPELKESEDEKIRKAIKEAIESYWSDDTQALNDALAWLEKQGEQKPEIKYIYPKFRVGDVIEPVKPNGHYAPVRVKYIGEGNYSCESDDCKSFLSFPVCNENEYVLTEQKPAWSEEDEKMLQKTLSTIRYALSIPADKEDEPCFVGSLTITWLKSLKGRYTWKPSEEQMDALRYVTNFDYGGHKATLVSLYEQLKKLK